MLRTRNNSFYVSCYPVFSEVQLKEARLEQNTGTSFSSRAGNWSPVRSHKQQTLHRTLGRVWIVERILIRQNWMMEDEKP